MSRLAGTPSFQAICGEPTPPCGKCGGKAATLRINRYLALAIYRCPCGHRWTIDLSSGR
jgi:hypothetical protein